MEYHRPASRMSSISSSSFSSSSLGPPSSWSWASVVCVVCSFLVGWVVVVVVVRVTGRVGCWSLLFVKSLSTEPHFKPACPVVSQVVSLVRSLSSLWVVVGRRYALRSSSHLLAGFPCYRYPLRSGDIAGFQLEISLPLKSTKTRILAITRWKLWKDKGR